MFEDCLTRQSLGAVDTCLDADGVGQGGDEGVVTMELSARKSTQPLKYFFKGENLRFEMQPEKGPTMVGLLDAKTGQMSVIMAEQKMYMTFGAPKGDLGRNAEQQVRVADRRLERQRRDAHGQR